MSPRSGILLLTGLFLFAQTPDPTRPTIRVSTQLVEINVVVRGKTGPVDNLARNDFRILEKGKEVKIGFFSMNSVHQARKTSAPLPRAKFTNRPAAGENPPSITVVLLDAVNTSIQDQNNAKQQFVKFLSQIRPEDHVAVYALGSRLRVLNEFTNDSVRLVRALAKYRGEIPSLLADSAPDPAGTEDADIDRWLNDRNALIADLNIVQRVRTTVAAMVAIANHIGRIPGRKNLIWITGSFPFSIGQHGSEVSTNWNDVVINPKGPMASGTSKKAAGLGDNEAYSVYGSDLAGDKPSRESFMGFDKEIARATQALNNANIAIYPVDARGLIAAPKILTAQGGTVSRSSARQAPIPLSMNPGGFDAMKSLAENTGGRAYFNTNDLKNAIRAAVDDSEVTYTLGFYADPGKLDGKFHPLTVQVKRKDVEVRYRKGYIANADSLPTDEQRANEIQDALWSPLDATGIAITGWLERVEKSKPGTVAVTLSIDRDSIAFQSNGGHRMDTVDVVFGLWGADGRDLGTIRQKMNLNLDDTQFERMRGGLVVTKTLDSAPDVSRVRVVLLDRNSGKIGSLTMTPTIEPRP